MAQLIIAFSHKMDKGDGAKDIGKWQALKALMIEWTREWFSLIGEEDWSEEVDEEIGEESEEGEVRHKKLEPSPVWYIWCPSLREAPKEEIIR